MSERLPSRLAELLDNLALMDDRASRVEALISLSERYSPVPAEVASKPYPESHKVPGCESEVYAWAVPQGEGKRFYFAVENPQGISAMAMAHIIDSTLSGEPLEVVRAVPDEIVYKIFGRELSMGKSLGLMNMLRQTKALAAR